MSIGLKSNWVKPVIPDGYDQICVFTYPDGEAVLDFVNHETASFASEEFDVKLDWPWQDGYSPADKDWSSLGILPLR